jgi:hypothetical protein
VSQFVDKRLADLVADFSPAPTDRFDVLLVKHDVVRTHGNLNDALLRCWNAVKDAKKQPPLLSGRRDWFGGKSSTRIAAFSIRLRNSFGSESKTSSATVMNCSRVMSP